MSEKISFKLGNQVLEYDESITEYIDANKLVSGILIQGNGLFKVIASEYKKLGSADNLYGFCQHLGEVIPNAIAHTLVEYAIALGRYDFTEDSISEYDPDNSYLLPLASNLGKIIDAYEEIKNKLLSEEQRRAIRKESRMRIIGGGFGIKGAAKGMIEAGAFNMATGFAHSIFNSVGNFFDRQEANFKLNAIYENPLTLQLILDGIQCAYFTAFYMFNSRVMGTDINVPNLMVKANNMFNNLTLNRIPQDRTRDVAIEILKINPFINVSIYKHLFDDETCDETFKEELKVIWKYFAMDSYNDLHRERIMLSGTDTTECLNLLQQSSDYLFTEHDKYSLLVDKVSMLSQEDLWCDVGIKNILFELITHKNNDILHDKHLLNLNFNTKAYVSYTLLLDEQTEKNVSNFVVNAFLSCNYNSILSYSWCKPDDIVYNKLLEILNQSIQDDNIQIWNILMSVVLTQDVEIIKNKSFEISGLYHTILEKVINYDDSKLNDSLKEFSCVNKNVSLGIKKMAVIQIFQYYASDDTVARDFLGRLIHSDIELAKDIVTEIENIIEYPSEEIRRLIYKVTGKIILDPVVQQFYNEIEEVISTFSVVITREYYSAINHFVSDYGCFRKKKDSELYINNMMQSYGYDANLNVEDILFMCIESSETNSSRYGEKGFVITKDRIVSSRHEQWLFKDVVGLDYNEETNGFLAEFYGNYLYEKEIISLHSLPNSSDFASDFRSFLRNVCYHMRRYKEVFSSDSNYIFNEEHYTGNEEQEIVAVISAAVSAIQESDEFKNEYNFNSLF